MKSALNRPICILGLGLIGGSLLRDLKAQGHPAFGYNRSPSSAAQAMDEGFDVSDDLVATLARAEKEQALIVLATPMGAIPTLLDALQEHAPTCGFTDVVSVKGRVLDLVRERSMADRYVGGHPMAGTADSGWSASQRGLFNGAAWVVTYDHALDHALDARAGSDADGAGPSSEWIALWTDVVHLANLVGAETIPSRVQHHDAAVARISHLPHVLAEALAVVGDNGGALALSLAAGSFRDATRVAGSAPSLVRAMCETNADALRDVLDEAIDLLTDARANLQAPNANLEELVDAGYRSRIRFEARSGVRSAADSVSPAPLSSRPILRVRAGAPGWVRQLIQAENLGARIEVF